MIVQMRPPAASIFYGQAAGAGNQAVATPTNRGIQCLLRIC